MKDLGEMCYLLGVELIRSQGGIWLLQRQYSLEMPYKCEMTGYKPISNPLEQNVKLNVDSTTFLLNIQTQPHQIKH